MRSSTSHYDAARVCAMASSSHSITRMTESLDDVPKVDQNKSKLLVSRITAFIGHFRRLM